MTTGEQLERRQSTLGDFLRKKREQLSPEAFGFSTRRRRTPGLRREEVATLASVSVTWYSWLEQGRAEGVSVEMLHSLANVLKLTADERNYVLRLTGHVGLKPYSEAVPASTQVILDHLSVPAYVIGHCGEVVCWNAYATAVFGDFATYLGENRNLIWYMFTNPDAKSATIDWEVNAKRLVAQLHADDALYADDPPFHQLITQLCVTSDVFAAMWRQHPVQERSETTKHVYHAEVGNLSFLQTTMQLIENPRLRMVVFTPETETETEARFTMLVHRNEI